MGDAAMHDSRTLDLSESIASPTHRLLAQGSPNGHMSEFWPDYVAEFGVGVDDVTALIEMACDTALNMADPNSREAWAPMHAWRALGQLRAEAAIAPLLDLLARVDDDLAHEELPCVLGMIGAAAVAPLAEFLSDRGHETFTAVAAAFAVAEVGKRHPDCRDTCVATLRHLLDPPGGDPTVNGFAICYLLDLGAVDTIDTIREAFQRDDVDITVVGDVEDVEIEFGLREHRATPARPLFPWLRRDLADLEFVPALANEPRRSNKTGRNQPCPCGSGRKYKKCCLS